MYETSLQKLKQSMDLNDLGECKVDTKVEVKSDSKVQAWVVKQSQETKFEPPRDKTNNVAVRPVKTQISLGIRPVWSESSLYAQWVAKGPSFLHVDCEDSDQTWRMPRLIWVLAGHTLTLLVLSRGSSF